MTKTLTEQWCEGKLPDGAYYILVDKYEQNEPEIDVGVCYNSNFEWWIVKEVLAPVPSYEKVKEMSQKIERLEFDNEALEMAHNEGKEINAELTSKNEQLEKKLAIATKALKEINKNYRFTVAQDVVYKALKEMEGVK